MTSCYRSIDELDVTFYCQHHSDLHALSEDEAVHHYVHHGRNEGRPGLAGATRETLPLDPGSSTAMLEIGPFGKPYMTGPNVRYADVYSTDSLRALATPESGMRPQDCPEIHYNLSEIRLRDLTERFASAFSSHCIEHQPDFVAHLNDVGAVLEDGAPYFIVCPDKRYCFDHFRPLSTILDVVAAHIDERRQVDTRTLLASLLQVAHNDAGRHWAGDHGAPSGDAGDAVWHHSLSLLRSRGPGYIDAHAWQFMPESFAAICDQLHKLRLIDLVPEAVFETPKYRQEFCAVLRRAKSS